MGAPCVAEFLEYPKFSTVFLLRRLLFAQISLLHVSTDSQLSAQPQCAATQKRFAALRILADSEVSIMISVF